MFILDTNVISELKKKAKADRNVAGWAAGHHPHTFYLSAISILEIEIGTLRASRNDAAKAAHLRDWMDNYILPQFDDRILPVDTAVAMRCAALHVPDPKSDRDAYIAATALIHDLTVVTRNTRDFEGTGVKLFNPWEAAA